MPRRGAAPWLRDLRKHRDNENACAPDAPTDSAYRTALRHRVRRSLLEHRRTAQPIRHVRHRFAFGEETRPPRVVTAAPAPHPLAAQRAFLELEAAFACLFDHLHDASIAQRRDYTQNGSYASGSCETSAYCSSARCFRPAQTTPGRERGRGREAWHCQDVRRDVVHLQPGRSVSHFLRRMACRGGERRGRRPRPRRCDRTGCVSHSRGGRGGRHRFGGRDRPQPRDA